MLSSFTILSPIWDRCKSDLSVCEIGSKSVKRKIVKKKQKNYKQTGRILDMAQKFALELLIEILKLTSPFTTKIEVKN